MNPLFRDSFPSPGPGGPAAAPSDRAEYHRITREVRDAIRTGRIPARPADQMWGGSGAGTACAICNRRLERHEVEYELAFSRGAGAGAYHVHVACCMAWEAELS